MIGIELSELPEVQDANDARDVFDKLVRTTMLQYSYNIWQHYFKNSKHICKLLALSVLEQKVAFHVFSGTIIGESLASGLLFPTQEKDGGFLLQFPLLFVFGLASQFTFPLDVINPFQRVDEGGFEIYVGKLITALSFLFTFWKVDLQQSLLMISLLDVMLPHQPLLTRSRSMKASLTENYQRLSSKKSKVVKMIADPKLRGSRLEEIDLMEGKYVVRSNKRRYTGDIYAPFANIQVKSSRYVGKGQTSPLDHYVQAEKNVVSVMDERKKAGGGLFVLITNKPFRGDLKEIPDGIVVICAQTLAQFFRVCAPMFIVLLDNSKLINNTCECFKVEKCNCRRGCQCVQCT